MPDGVIADFMRAFNSLVGLPPELVPSEYNYTGVLTRAELNAGFERAKAIPNWFLGLEPYRPNVHDLAVWLAYHSGHDVWIVTSRFETVGLSVALQTKMWIDMCGVKGYDNYFGVLTVPHSDDKVDICSRLNIDWIVDDKTETIESMDRFPYLHAALLDRPWNQDAQVKWRVKSLGEFLKEIK